MAAKSYLLTMTTSYVQNNKKFKYYNANPYNDIENDCVCRAISTATNIPYRTVAQKLRYTAKLFNCDMLCVCCYSHFLEDILKLQKYDALGNTVEQISKKYCNKIVLIRMNGHLTLSRYGIVYDIWDCTQEIADVYWLVN